MAHPINFIDNEIAYNQGQWPINNPAFGIDHRADANIDQTLCYMVMGNDRNRMPNMPVNDDTAPFLTNWRYGAMGLIDLLHDFVFREGNIIGRKVAIVENYNRNANNGDHLCSLTPIGVRLVSLLYRINHQHNLDWMDAPRDPVPDPVDNLDNIISEDEIYRYVHVLLSHFEYATAEILGGLLSNGGPQNHYNQISIYANYTNQYQVPNVDPANPPHNRNDSLWDIVGDMMHGHIPGHLAPHVDNLNAVTPTIIQDSDDPMDDRMETSRMFDLETSTRPPAVEQLGLHREVGAEFFNSHYFGDYLFGTCHCVRQSDALVIMSLRNEMSDINTPLIRFANINRRRPIWIINYVVCCATDINIESVPDPLIGIGLLSNAIPLHQVTTGMQSIRLYETGPGISEQALDDHNVKFCTVVTTRITLELCGLLANSIHEKAIARPTQRVSTQDITTLGAFGVELLIAQALSLKAIPDRMMVGHGRAIVNNGVLAAGGSPYCPILVTNDKYLAMYCVLRALPVICNLTPGGGGPRYLRLLRPYRMEDEANIATHVMRKPMLEDNGYPTSIVSTLVSRRYLDRKIVPGYIDVPGEEAISIRTLRAIYINKRDVLRALNENNIDPAIVATFGDTLDECRQYPLSISLWLGHRTLLTERDVPLQSLAHNICAGQAGAHADLVGELTESIVNYADIDAEVKDEISSIIDEVDNIAMVPPEAGAIEYDYDSITDQMARLLDIDIRMALNAEFPLIDLHSLTQMHFQILYRNTYIRRYMGKVFFVQNDGRGPFGPGQNYDLSPDDIDGFLAANPGLNYQQRTILLVFKRFAIDAAGMEENRRNLLTNYVLLPLPAASTDALLEGLREMDNHMIELTIVTYNGGVAADFVSTPNMIFAGYPGEVPYGYNAANIDNNTRYVEDNMRHLEESYAERLVEQLIAIAGGYDFRPDAAAVGAVDDPGDYINRVGMLKRNVAIIMIAYYSKLLVGNLGDWTRCGADIYDADFAAETVDTDFDVLRPKANAYADERQVPNPNNYNMSFVRTSYLVCARARTIVEASANAIREVYDNGGAPIDPIIGILEAHYFPEVVARHAADQGHGEINPFADNFFDALATAVQDLPHNVIAEQFNVA